MRTQHSTPPVECVCETCGKPFIVSAARIVRYPVRFCSLPCRRNSASARRDQSCRQCGKTFSAFPNEGRQFCSDDCRNLAARKREIRHCQQCGKPFTCRPSAVTKICSKRCVHASLTRTNYPSGVCARCGSDFEIRGRPGQKFCSRTCSDATNHHTTTSWMEKPCERCGTTFGFFAASYPQGRRYCSQTCANQYVRTPPPRPQMACEACGKIVSVKPSKTGRFRACSPHCRAMLVARDMPRISSIERKMAAAFASRGLRPVPQLLVLGYVVDFAFAASKVIIECDGTYWHGRPHQQEKDRRKDVILTSAGWRVLRLTETAINNDPQRCADQVAMLLIHEQPPSP